MLTTLVSGIPPNKFGLFVLLPVLFTVASVVITSQLFLFATNYVLSLFKLGFIKIATPIKGPVWATEQRMREKKSNWSPLKSFIFTTKTNSNIFQKNSKNSVRDIDLRVHKTKRNT